MLPLLLLLTISLSTAINLRPAFPVPFSLTISGQILFLDNHQAQITANSRLIIRLRDIFSKSNRALIITSKTVNASIFPIQFNISYNPNVIFRDHIHVIDATIFNEANIATFQTDRPIAVTLLGPGRTTYLDIALRAIYPFETIPQYQIHEWPQLLGMIGFDAMKIIMKETGFTNVFIVTDESQIPKDLRHDRVFIFVDNYGCVQRVPSVG